MADPHSLAPAEQLATALPMLHARFHEFDATAELVVGISEAQRQLLECLDERGRLNNGTLCTLLGRAQSSVSELVDRLAQRGWVQRMSESDRRKSSYVITEEGRQALANYRFVQRQALVDRLAGLKAADQAALLRHLGVLLQTLGCDIPAQAPHAQNN